MWVSHPIWLRLAACAVVVVVCRRVRAAEETPRTLREPIEAVAGSEVGLLVVTTWGAVKVLDAAGRVVRVLWSPRESAGRSRGATAPLPAWPGLTADSDFSGAVYDPDDIDDADDPRLADDTAARPWDIDEPSAHARTARSPPGTAPMRPLVAVSGAAGWVARWDGVWAVDLPTGAARHVYGGGGSRIRALAAGLVPAGGTIVAVVDGDRLLRAHADPSASGGDLAFATVGGPVGALGGLAIGASETLFVLAADGGLRAHTPAAHGTGDAGMSFFTSSVDDIVACDSGALVLSNETLWLVRAMDSAATPVMRRLGPAPPGTERLACGPAGSGWAAFGAGVATSTDQGRTWETRVPAASLPFRAVVPVPATLWIAMPMGLWPLPAAGAAHIAATAEVDLRAAPTTLTVAAASGTSDFWRRWSAVLPVVDLDFEIGRLGLVREVRGMVTASFRLDPPWWAAALARPRRRRRPDAGAEAQAARQLDALAIGGRDATAEDERRALARILEEFP